jgi:hypothetical protein
MLAEETGEAWEVVSVIQRGGKELAAKLGNRNQNTT